MPLKKKTPEGPKAKLMKQTIPALRKKAKALGISDYTKRPKENLVQSIMLAEARKKRGTTAGKKSTAKRKTMGGVAPSSARSSAKKSYQTGRSYDSRRDSSRSALPPGKRKSASGSVYYERRKNRSDKPGTMLGFVLPPLNSFVG